MSDRNLVLLFAAFVFLTIWAFFSRLTCGRCGFGWVGFLKWVQRRLGPIRVIWDRPGLAPYISRSYFWARPKHPDGGWAFDVTGQPLPGIKLRDFPVTAHLHQIHQSDSEPELHSHPWSWAVSLILSGGYVEERRNPKDHRIVRIRRVRPGQIVFFRHDTYHRLDLIGGRECWSLFIAGPRREEPWRFWNRETAEDLPFQEFIARRRA